ncbi:Sugar kinase of the NBD/HSP70 family, may contain an N-terminal HTH domain [Bryocella elongata]|uniref:Sugar kinase of the NBD/HSP70 family, may contain an N-terminal HTH domain n=1 Tax=Bryocella elongata TaxID=863522 RepID=A0A1H6BME4_9BACT|nr:ROK family protein [Bryocella elongata]SEG61840.1 Sugar kinase of the NBD/HSP70 family, may contain an N-terminal HTH domain [Bryocella elongata]
MSEATSSAATTIVGVTISERLLAGMVTGHVVDGPILAFPEPRSTDGEDDNPLIELPADDLANAISDLVARVMKGREKELKAVGISLPGYVKNGVVEEAPNLPQLKGARFREMVMAGLAARGMEVPVVPSNDADAIAAGLASQRGKLDSTIRVWTLGTGIGFGMYPFTGEVMEGGHSVVSLDDKENYCGCGGRGHLEGIMGHRAMRLRFLDMEPEEVFEAANKRSDARCVEFKQLWHKALAAATASSIHFAGAGKFYLSGYNVRFVDLPMLRDYLHQMVKMSSLQSYSMEIVAEDQETRIVGAAVFAEQAEE